MTFSNTVTRSATRLTLTRLALTVAALSLCAPPLAAASAAPDLRIGALQRANPAPEASCPNRVKKLIQYVQGWRVDTLGSQQARDADRGLQSLRLAVLTGNTTYVRELLHTFSSQAKDRGGAWVLPANRTRSLQASLDDAALADRPNVVRLLVQYGAKPNFNGEWLGVPALTVAARCGNIETMRALRAVGADVSTPINRDNESSTAPRTALEVAVWYAQSGAVIWLVHHGANVCGKMEISRLERYVSASQKMTTRALTSEALNTIRCRVAPTGA